MTVYEPRHVNVARERSGSGGYYEEEEDVYMEDDDEDDCKWKFEDSERRMGM